MSTGILLRGTVVRRSVKNSPTGRPRMSTMLVTKGGTYCPSSSTDGRFSSEWRTKNTDNAPIPARGIRRAAAIRVFMVRWSMGFIPKKEKAIYQKGEGLLRTRSATLFQNGPKEKLASLCGHRPGSAGWVCHPLL